MPRSLTLLGWILLVLEALFVIVLFFQRNLGDDAAGRGMARGFSYVLAPIVLLAGAAFVWGQQGGPRGAFWAGLLVLAVPLLFGAFNFAGGTLRKLERTIWRAQAGRFEDGRLTRMARAIDRNDTAELSRLLAAGPTDFAARDRMGRTLLGHAIARAIAWEADTGQVEPVRVLLAAGAPPAADALAPTRTVASVSEHDLVYHLVGVGNPGAVLVLDTVLGAGADPNVLDEDGRPLLFSTYLRLPALEVLAKHHVNMQAVDTRPDRLGYSALMHAASMGEWGLAGFFLQHGVPPDHRAPDGTTLDSILAEIDPPGTKWYGPSEAEHAAFRAAYPRRR